MKIRTLILGIVLLLPVTQAYAEKMHIAIMDFDAKDIPRKEAEKISELIRSEMVSVGEFTVIERNQMDKILKEQGFQQTGCTDISCAVNIGKILSARKILVGSLMKIAGQIVISGRIVDVEKGVADFGEKEQVRDQDDLYNAVERFVRKFALKISIKSDVDKYKGVKKANYPTVFGWLSLPCGLLGAGAGGMSVYYNTKLSATNVHYDKFKQYYYLSPSAGAAVYYHMKMEKTRKVAVDQEKWMNITAITAGSLGALGISFLIVHIVKYAKANKTSPAKTGMIDNVNFFPYLSLGGASYGMSDKKDAFNMGMQCSLRF